MKKLKHNIKFNIMFINSRSSTELDISIYNNIPKHFAHIKNKKFLDWEIPPWDLLIYSDKLLGEGNFGKVYLAKWRDTLVVAKVMHEHLGEKEKNLLLREFDTMSKMHHPNIVQLYGYIDDPFTIIMEYFEQGNLLDKMSKLKLSQKRKISLEIARGMRFLHERKPHNIMHRDIKPTNILLTKSLRAKIADFGLARIDNTEPPVNFTESNNNLTSQVGTKRYMAPEIIHNKIYDKKVDIYAFGILLYELFEDTRFIPGQHLIFRKSSKSLQRFIKKMLDNNPDMRPDTASIYKELSNIFNTKNKFSSFVLSYF